MPSVFASVKVLTSDEEYLNFLHASTSSVKNKNKRCHLLQINPLLAERLPQITPVISLW